MMNKFFEAFHNYKFKTKLLISYVIVGMLPIIIWSYFSYKQSNGYLYEQAKESFGNLYNNIYQTIDNQFTKYINDFQFVSRNERIGQIINSDYTSGYDKYKDVVNEYDPIVNTITSLNPAIEKVLIFTDGGLRNSRVNFKGKEEIPQNMREKVNSTPELLWFADDKFIYIVQSIPNGVEYEKYGVLLFKFSKQGSFSFLSVDRMENMQLRITDSSGVSQLVYNPNNLSFEKSSKSTYTLGQEFSQNGWKLIMDIDLSSVEIAPFETVLTTVIVIIFSIILLILLVMVFTKNLNNRIFSLNQQLSDVVKSGFRSHIYSPYHDEIGEITNTVGKVIDEIKVMINEVYESKLILREAEIKALQSQINPHFLYNTLSVINWEAIKIGNNDISRIVNALSAFYRSTLNKGNDITTVQNEVDNVKAYMEIQLFIHRNSFEVEYELSENIMEYSMPCIILQPIVENAIEHGVNLKKDSKGEILIKIFERGNDIVFEVSDNGRGISKEMINEILVKSTKGYGVKNVNDRLKLFFGKKYGLTIESEEGIGTKVTVKIPKCIN